MIAILRIIVSLDWSYNSRLSATRLSSNGGISGAAAASSAATNGTAPATNGTAPATNGTAPSAINGATATNGADGAASSSGTGNYEFMSRQIADTQLELSRLIAERTRLNNFNSSAGDRDHLVSESVSSNALLIFDSSIRTLSNRLEHLRDIIDQFN